MSTALFNLWIPHALDNSLKTMELDWPHWKVSFFSNGQLMTVLYITTVSTLNGLLTLRGEGSKVGVVLPPLRYSPLIPQNVQPTRSFPKTEDAQPTHGVLGCWWTVGKHTSTVFYTSTSTGDRRSFQSNTNWKGDNFVNNSMSVMLWQKVISANSADHSGVDDCHPYVKLH